MKRLEIRGIIVPSQYDDPWFEDYIARGIITPESRFRKALADIGDEDAVEVYINSPGGSVFAGNEMINTLQEWRRARSDARQKPRQVNITIGSLAASMGAALAISAGDTCRMHRNGKLMFHSAWTQSEGGPDALRDDAQLLDKINKDLKGILVSRFSCNPDEVETWFAEGRAGWLSADDAKARGIVSEIIGEDAPAGATVEFQEAAALATKNLKIAACAGVLDLKPAPAPLSLDDGIQKAEGLIAELQQKLQALTKANVKAAADRDEAFKQRDEARKAQAGADRALATLQADFDAAKTAHATALVEAKADHDKDNLKHQTRITSLTEQNTAHATRLARLTGQVLGAPSTDGGDEPTSWNDAMKRCGGMTEKAYVEARMRWPALFARSRATDGCKPNTKGA